MERGKEPQVQGIHISTTLNNNNNNNNKSVTPLSVSSYATIADLEQEFCDLKMAVGTGVMEWDQTPLVLGMHISTLLEQQLDHAHSVVASSQVQGSRLQYAFREVTHYGLFP